MWLTLEKIALCLGVFGTGLFLSTLYFRDSFSTETLEYFRGGNLGSITVGILILIGMVGILLFIFHLFRKRFDNIFIRLVLLLSFILSLILMGNSGI